MIDEREEGFSRPDRRDPAAATARSPGSPSAPPASGWDRTWIGWRRSWLGSPSRSLGSVSRILSSLSSRSVRLLAACASMNSTSARRSGRLTSGRRLRPAAMSPPATGTHRSRSGSTRGRSHRRRAAASSISRVAARWAAQVGEGELSVGEQRPQLLEIALLDLQAHCDAGRERGQELAAVHLVGINPSSMNPFLALFRNTGDRAAPRRRRSGRCGGFRRRSRLARLP